jgi:sec-independent protein translocase protein TatA
MFRFGVPELLILATIVMLVFSVGKLPEIGSSFGKAIGNFKKAVADNDKTELKHSKES